MITSHYITFCRFLCVGGVFSNQNNNYGELLGGKHNPDVVTMSSLSSLNSVLSLFLSSTLKSCLVQSLATHFLSITGGK